MRLPNLPPRLRALATRLLPRRPRPRELGVTALVLAALMLHLADPDRLGWGAVLGFSAGLLGGLALAGLRGPGRARAAHPGTALVMQDILTLRQALGVLQQQVAATIQSSEAAVLSMMERMHRVHRNAGQLRGRILEAVQRSEGLSAESLGNADRHGRAVASLAAHQRAFEDRLRGNQGRIQAVAGQVRALAEVADRIGDISKQTNLLAINASIEAARAGPEGAGFKVVATEVRRLAQQTAEAAQQITQGIGQAAQAIDQEVAASLQAQAGESSGEQLEQIAQHIDALGRSLGEVVPYLGELSVRMDRGMEDVTEDIVNTLGDMQFQDINRQLLEQINQALGSLSDHFTQLYQLVDGDAPPPPVMLEELLSRWTEDYVMQAQRSAHDRALAQAEPARPAAAGAPGARAPAGAAQAGAGNPATPAAAPVPPREDDTPVGELALAVAQGPRIELF